MKTKENQNLQKIIKGEIKNMKKQGISLVMLVITIIVMTIIAGAVIMTLSDSGVMDKANEAVNETNLKQVQQLATLAWGDAYLDKLKDSTVDIEQRVIDALIAAKVDMSKYDLEVTSGGVRVSTKAKEGTLGSLITSARDYGKTVNYVSANGITDWKVFYETEDYVYLIASEKLIKSKVPTNIPVIEIVEEENHATGYSNFVTINGVTKELGMLSLSDEEEIQVANIQRPSLWMAQFNNGDYSVNKSAIISSYFLDETYWTGFLNTSKYLDDNGESYVVGAIGTPTLEMFCASWNAKRNATKDMTKYNVELNLTEMEKCGYEINYTYDVNISEKDNLYIWNSSIQGNNVYLASPVYLDAADVVVESRVMFSVFGNGASVGNSVARYSNDGGLRPVVCLRKDIPAKTVGTTGYQI